MCGQGRSKTSGGLSGHVGKRLEGETWCWRERLRWMRCSKLTCGRKNSLWCWVKGLLNLVKVLDRPQHVVLFWQSLGAELGVWRFGEIEALHWCLILTLEFSRQRHYNSVWASCFKLVNNSQWWHACRLRDSTVHVDVVSGGLDF